MSLLSASVSLDDDGAHFSCPVTGCAFTSRQWPTRKSATARAQQHFDEHKGLGVMPELQVFRAEHGLVVGDDGRAVRVEDLP